MTSRFALAAKYLLLAFAAYAAVAWVLRQPRSHGRTEQFLVVVAPVKLLGSASETQGLLPVFFGLVVVAVLMAVALGAVFLWRSTRVRAARDLSTSLACGSAAVAYVFLLRYFPELGGPTGPYWALALDFLAGGLYAASLLAAVKFFAQYPFGIDLEAFIREELMGKRLEAVPPRLPILFRKLGGGGEVQTAAERTAQTRRWIERMMKPASQGAIVLAFAAASAGVSRVALFWDTLHGVVCMLMAVYVFWFGLGCLRYKYRRALEDDRLRIQWLYFGAWAAGLMMLVWAALAMVLPLRPAGDLPAMAFVTLPSIAPVLAGLIGLAALCVSVFYRGAVDPGLAIRRSTVFAMLIGLVGVLFVLAERVIGALAASHFGVSHDAGAVLAGGFTAALIWPLRKAVEDGGRRLAERFTPVSELADGPRHPAAIAFSDLAGYTALSAVDERAAVVAAALFHREAKRSCQRHGGRLVKTIGDAVLLEFPEAAQAVAAVSELHASYPPAAAALDLPVLGIHSGIHAGEVMVAPDGDVYGAVVNLAARLQGHAKDGEVVVSQDVRSACVAFEFRALGGIALKNVPGRTEAFTL